MSSNIAALLEIKNAFMDATIEAYNEVEEAKKVANEEYNKANEAVNNVFDSYNDILSFPEKNINIIKNKSDKELHEKFKNIYTDVVKIENHTKKLTKIADETRNAFNKAEQNKITLEYNATIIQAHYNAAAKAYEESIKGKIPNPIMMNVYNKLIDLSKQMDKKLENICNITTEIQTITKAITDYSIGVNKYTDEEFLHLIEEIKKRSEQLIKLKHEHNSLKRARTEVETCYITPPEHIKKKLFTKKNTT